MKKFSFAGMPDDVRRDYEKELIRLTNLTKQAHYVDLVLRLNGEDRNIEFNLLKYLTVEDSNDPR